MPTVEKAAEVKKAPEVKAPYVFPFTLGADPEFTIISGTKPVNAKEILKTFMTDFREGTMGYDLPGGNVGWDGHDATGELRPKPGNPREVTANFKSMFTEVQKRMPFVEMNTLTIAAATGGHIHLSIPESMNHDLEGATTKMNAVKRAVGSFLLTIMIAENRLSRELRRRGGSYGSLLDFRTGQQFRHPSGATGYTLEVRAMNAEWITTEKICLGTLAYMAICWDMVIKHFNGDKNALKPVAEIIFPSQKAATDNLAPLLSNYANLQKLYLNKIKPFVRAHPAYNEYKDALELIMSTERVQTEKKTSHYSISEGWGLSRDIKSIKSSDFTNTEKVEEASSKFPESVIRNLSQFAWNDDVNVQAFSTALGKRCISLGWKPNHEYFLFGLKKGMDALVIRNEAGELLSGIEIMKTRKDYDVIQHKFERLSPKAAPAYGRFLHPRTGELMKDTELQRVMIGIPYDMRQKMDMKGLIKLVLKYEKNPKSMMPISRDALPEGESKIEANLKASEAHEAGFERSIARGEKPREIRPEDIAHEREARTTAASFSDNVVLRNTAGLGNLASWIGLRGIFSVAYAADFAQDSRVRLSPAVIPSAPEDILAWYEGREGTFTNLGQLADAVDVLAEVFNVPDFNILSRFQGNSYRGASGRVRFSSEGLGYDFSFNADDKDEAITDLIGVSNTF